MVIRRAAGAGAALCASFLIAACGPNGHHPGTGGAGGGPNPDAGGADAAPQADASPGDAGTFPDCLPACIRDALLPCLPALDSCTFEHVADDSGAPFFSDTTCAAGSSWKHTSVAAYHSLVDTISLNGATCFTKTYGWGSGFVGTVRWVDGTGTQVAAGIPLGDGSGNTAVACGASLPTSREDSIEVSGACLARLDRCQSTTPGSCP